MNSNGVAELEELSEICHGSQSMVTVLANPSFALFECFQWQCGGVHIY